jgi:hypothetical protein
MENPQAEVQNVHRVELGHAQAILSWASGWLCPNEPFIRGLTGRPPTKPVPSTRLSLGHFPANLPPSGKQAIVKIHVPPILKDPGGNCRPMLVYTQKRDFSCILQREDGQREWDRLSDVIRKQTVSALKGYFIVDIKSRDKLVVKVSEPLATQPWGTLKLSIATTQIS